MQGWQRGWGLALMICVAAGAAQADWPYFSGGADGNCATEANAYPPLRPKWRFRAQGGFYLTPTAVGGLIYAGSRDGSVYAIDADAGAPRWSYAAEAEVYGGVTVGGERVFATCADGNLYALDALTGDLLWRYAVQGILYAPALHAEGVVVVGGGEGTLLHAVDAERGRRLWVFGMEGRLGSAMAARDGVVYAGSYDRRLYAIDLRTGEPRWSFEGHGYFDSCPLVTEERVYAKTPDDVIYALDRATGEAVWTYDPWENPEWATQTVNWSPLATAGDDLLLFASNDRYVAALDLQTHTLRWQQSFEEDVSCAPLVVGEVAYLGTKDGNLYALAAGNGRIVWSRRREAPASTEFLRGYMWPPSLDDGVLYISSLDGTLEAYQTTAVASAELKEALEQAPAPREEPARTNIFGEIDRD